MIGPPGGYYRPSVCRVSQPEGPPPPRQAERAPPGQAEFAICDHTIECGFKDTKRGGWHWQQTKTTDPERAARLWLAIAVATLWVLSVGGESDANLPVSTLSALPATHIARRRTTGRTQPRLLSCFRRGLLRILAAAIAGETLPEGRFDPEPWLSSAVPDASGLFAWPAQALNAKTYP